MKKATNNQQKETKTNEGAMKMENISSDSKITAATVETAEEMTTVTTAAQEIATKGEIEAAKAAEKAAKTAAQVAKEEEQLKKATTDENGKFILVVLYENDGAMSYFIDKNFCKIRINNKMAGRIFDEGRAVKIHPQQAAELLKAKKAEKKAKAAEAKKAA